MDWVVVDWVVPVVVLPVDWVVSVTVDPVVVLSVEMVDWLVVDSLVAVIMIRKTTMLFSECVVVSFSFL